jgi:hypothetical protein
MLMLQTECYGTSLSRCGIFVTVADLVPPTRHRQSNNAFEARPPVTAIGPARGHAQSVWYEGVKSTHGAGADSPKMPFPGLPGLPNPIWAKRGFFKPTPAARKPDIRGCGRPRRRACAWPAQRGSASSLCRDGYVPTDRVDDGGQQRPHRATTSNGLARFHHAAGSSRHARKQPKHLAG